jgi:hypothetical protein
MDEDTYTVKLYGTSAQGPKLAGEYRMVIRPASRTTSNKRMRLKGAWQVGCRVRRGFKPGFFLSASVGRFLKVLSFRLGGWLARMWTNQQSQFQQEVPMKDRIKWLGVGVGVMYGTQLMILLIVHNLISTSAPPEFSDLLATVV